MKKKLPKFVLMFTMCVCVCVCMIAVHHTVIFVVDHIHLKSRI